jgi:Putative methyltransferase
MREETTRAVNPHGRDWHEWHQAYDKPGSGLYQRLVTVQGHLRDALDQLPSGPIRLVGICAGQGRDVTGVLQDHPRAGDVVGRLVELDERNVADARTALAEIGADGIEVVTADAGQSDAYLGAVPADVVLACGVFGNISDEDIARTIELLPGLCAPGAWVIWTRGRLSADVTPAIRGWFAEHGFEELAFSFVGGSMGVGAHRFDGAGTTIPAGTQLFQFVGYNVLHPQA